MAHLDEDHIRAVTYILQLCATLPTISHRVRNWDIDDWDVDKFMQSYGVASSGERYAMLFVANVWNPGYAREQGWTFDMIEAAGTLDSTHRRAIMTWLANPRFP
jgi:hypothetical protein